MTAMKKLILFASATALPAVVSAGAFTIHHSSNANHKQSAIHTNIPGYVVLPQADKTTLTGTRRKNTVKSLVLRRSMNGDDDMRATDQEVTKESVEKTTPQEQKSSSTVTTEMDTKGQVAEESINGSVNGINGGVNGVNGSVNGVNGSKGRSSVTNGEDKDAAAPFFTSDDSTKINGGQVVETNGEKSKAINGGEETELNGTGAKTNGEIKLGTNGQKDLDLKTNGDRKGTEFELTEDQEEMLTSSAISGDEAYNSPFNKYVNEITGPIFGPEIEKGVSRDTIKGALVSGVALTFLTNTFDPNVAGLVALWTAYISITPGKTGNVARVFGDAAWDTSKTVLRTLKDIAFELGIRIPFLRDERKTPINGQPLLMGREEIQLDDDIVNLVKEVEDTVADVETVLSNSNEVRDAIAHEELLADEADRLAEEARRLEIEYLLEEARIEKEAYQAEEEFRAVEAQIAEEERLEKEAELALYEEEQRIMAEEERIAKKERLILEAEQAEKERLIEEKRAAEKARLAEEAEKQKLAEEKRAAEKAQLAEEEKLADQVDGPDDDSFIDEMEWEASIQLADEIDQDEENKSEWNAARQLANDLTDDDGGTLLDYDSPDLTDDERQEQLAQALRAAVEKSELQRQEEEKIAEREKEKRNLMRRELQYADILETPSDTQEVISMDEGAEEIKTREDYQKMTVKKLKELLRSRGLKVSGRKAELIERLISE